MQQDNNRTSQTQIQGGVNAENGENSINIKDIIFLVLNNWYWFVLSVLVCLLVAGVYYKTQPKAYSASGTILVRDNNNGGNVRASRNMDALLNNMGMDNSMLSLENEIYMLRSSSLMSQVVRRLDLQHYCTRDDLFTKITYYKNAPLALEVYDENIDREIELKMEVKPTGKESFAYTVYDFHRVSGSMPVYKKGTGTFGKPMNLDDSVVVVLSKTKFYNSSCEGVTFNIGVHKVFPLARKMINGLSVARVNKMASVLSITYNDANALRANEIVDTIR